MLSWDRKRFAGYIVKYFCKVWDNQGMFIFVPFPSLGFSQLLRRGTATGIIPDPAQELSCVLPQQVTFGFCLSCEKSKCGQIISAFFCSELMEALELFF